MTIAPNIIAIVVPATPEFGRNFFPGLIKEPQPITQPKAIAQTCIGDNCLRRELLSMISPFKHHRSYQSVSIPEKCQSL